MISGWLALASAVAISCVTSAVSAAGVDRRVFRGIGGVGLDLLLHHLAGADQVDRAGRLAARDLQGAVDQLLDVAAGTDLVVVLDVAAQDAALVRHVLDPVDELVPPAGQLTGDRERRGAGEDEHRDTAAHRVADRAAEVLGARVDVDEDGLRLPGHAGVGVRGGQRDGLVRAHDDPRELRLRRPPALAWASASIRPGWSLPRFAKMYLTPASARASRKAVLVV